jgi:hypothetical protein
MENLVQTTDYEMNIDLMLEHAYIFVNTFFKIYILGNLQNALWRKR